MKGTDEGVIQGLDRDIDIAGCCEEAGEIRAIFRSIAKSSGVPKSPQKRDVPIRVFFVEGFRKHENLLRMHGGEVGTQSGAPSDVLEEAKRAPWFGDAVAIEVSTFQTIMHLGWRDNDDVDIFFGDDSV